MFWKIAVSKSAILLKMESAVINWSKIRLLIYQFAFCCFFLGYKKYFGSFVACTLFKCFNTPNDIVCFTIWRHLFLKFWLVNTLVFSHWHHQRAVTHFDKVRQSNIRRGKKLGFQLSHRCPPNQKRLYIVL